MAGNDPEIFEYLIYQPEYLMVFLGGSMIQIFCKRGKGVILGFPRVGCFLSKREGVDFEC